MSKVGEGNTEARKRENTMPVESLDAYYSLSMYNTGTLITTTNPISSS